MRKLLLLLSCFFLVSKTINAQCEVTTSASQTTIRCGQSVSLTAFGQSNGTVVFTENFNNGNYGPGWASTPGSTTFSNPCSANGVDGTVHAWMGSNTPSPRTLTSSSLNLSTATAGVTICFDLLFASQGDVAPCEGPDEPDEGVYLQFSTNGGATWTDLNYFDPNGGNDPQLTNWNNWCFQLPPGAITANTIIRWHQIADSGQDYDHWGIDNVQIYQNDVSSLLVWLHDSYSYGIGSPGGVNPNSVSPTTTTTYTAQLTTGTGQTCTNTVTVNVLPPDYDINITATPSTLCVGECATLTATAQEIISPASTPTFENNEFALVASGSASVNINVQGLNTTSLNNSSITEVVINGFNFSGNSLCTNFGGCPCNGATIGFGQQCALNTSGFTVTLTAPGGCDIILVPSGVATGNYTNTTFVPVGGSAFGGTFPNGGTWSPSEPFSGLNGCNPNGVWSLTFSAPGLGIGVGTLSGWSISFNDPAIVGPVTYTWSPTTNMNNQNTLNPTVCPSSSQTYSLTVANSNPACPTGVESILVPVTSCQNCTPPVVTINQPASICSPQTVDLASSVTTSGSVIVSYYSSNANATSATNPLPSSVVSVSGTYFVRVEQNGNSTCYTVQQINVNVNSAPTLAITPANPIICAGSSVQLTASGATSYTWANATGLNTTNGAIVTATLSSTTTYTVTGTSNGCSSDQSITVTIGTDIVPTFQINPLCAGSNYTLPTTSTNNITGTWNQPFDNLNSAQYTFTPDAGQCAVATTVSVTITQQTTPTFNSVNPICSGGQLSTLPTTSNNNITGTWSPAIDNTTTTTYTFTPDAGQCAAVTNLTITVNQPITPTFPPMATAYCQDAIIIQPILPLQSNEGINGTWNPVAISTANLGTTLYTFTPLTFPAQCATTYTMNVTVGTSILPTFDPVATICAGDQLSELPTTSTNGIQGTWLPPVVNNLITTTYTFVPNPDQCGTSTQLTINVNTPIIPTFQPIAPVCEGTAIAALATTSDNGIIGSWNPAIDNTTTTTYTFTPSAGQCATPTVTVIVINQPQTPTFNQVSPVCAGQTFTLPNQSNDFIPINGTWSPVINNTASTTYTFTPDAGQCASQVNMTVVVNTAITPTFTQITPICAGGALSLPSQSNDVNPITGTWSPDVNNNASQVYTFTPANGQCATTTTMSVTVNSLPQASLTEMQTYCGLQNGSVSITNVNGGTPPYQYNFNNQGFGTVQTFNNLSSGTYPILISDANNCLYTTSANISASQSVNASFTATPMIGASPSLVSFTNNSTTGNNIDYYWYFGNTNDTSAFEPVDQLYNESGLYSVTLVVSNGNPLCNDTATIILKVEDKPYIIVPNIFTPNGDAINDLFLINSYGYTNLEIFIYNRWGTLITNYNPTQKSWDGSGESEGTYFFILKGKKPDGSDLDITGNILLVR